MAEEKITGEVSFRDYRNYFSYSLGLFGMVLYFIVCSFSQLVMLAVSLQLADWTD